MSVKITSATIKGYKKLGARSLDQSLHHARLEILEKKKVKTQFRNSNI